MRSVAPVIIAKTANVIIAAACFVFGILVVCYQELPFEAFKITSGVIMITLGAFKIGGYFSKDLFRLAFEHGVETGVISIVSGIAVLCGVSLEFLCAAFGICALADGLFKIKVAYDAKRFGINKWYLICAAACLACVTGAVLLFGTHIGARALEILFGAAMVTEGVLHFTVIITTLKVIRKKQPDGCDGERAI